MKTKTTSHSLTHSDSETPPEAAQMDWNGIEEVKGALRSILSASAREDSSRMTSGLDLWLHGEVTVKVRIKRHIEDNTLFLVETGWGEHIIRKECKCDMESLMESLMGIGVSALDVGSIEFLLAGYHDMTVTQVADRAKKLGELCLTGKCTYVPERVTLPQVDNVWYVRIKWRRTGLSVERETENEAGFTASQHRTWLRRDLRETETKALESIVRGVQGGEDSRRRILDLWVAGEVETAHVRIIPNNMGWISIEMSVGEEIITIETSVLTLPGGMIGDIKSLVDVVWENIRSRIGRIGSIEFLLAGYHGWTVKQVADRAMQLGELCLTGKCTYKPEMVTLPHVDDVWYVRIKWRPTWRLSVEPQTENQAGFRHCVPDIDSVGECVVCFDRLDWYGATGNTPVCLSCGHFLCARCLGEMEDTTPKNRLEHWYMATSFQNKCPLCNELYTEKKRWIPFPISQEMWKGLGRFES